MTVSEIISSVVVCAGVLLVSLSIALGMVGSLWASLYVFDWVASKVMFRLWTTELVLRTARHLWHTTKIPPPKGWEPLDIPKDAEFPEDVEPRKVKRGS